jgi:outer membrane protein assembly factor BamB
MVDADSRHHYLTSPAVANSVVFVCSDDTTGGIIHALDALSGTELWSANKQDTLHRILDFPFMTIDEDIRRITPIGAASHSRAKPYLEIPAG